MPLQLSNPKGISFPQQAGELFQILFKDYPEVIIRDEFGAGFSGSRVFLVLPVKDKTSPELSVVVKIATAGLIEQEWQAYQSCIAGKLSGAALITGEPVYSQNGNWGGIRYTLVGSGVFEVESLRHYYRNAGVEDILFALSERLFPRLDIQRAHSVEDRTFSFQSSYDFVLPVNLIIEPGPLPKGKKPCIIRPNTLSACSLKQGDYARVEGFVITETDIKTQTLTLNAVSPYAYRLRLCPVKNIAACQKGRIFPVVSGRVIETRYTQLQDKILQAMGKDFALSQAEFTLPDGAVLPNPLLLLPDILNVSAPVRVSCIHGDLNIENILIDPKVRDARLIDFATARRDHLLHDMLRLETEVITRLLPGALMWADLPPESIHTLYRHLHTASFPAGKIPTPPFSRYSLRKPFAALAAIRRQAAKSLFKQGEWKEYYRGLLLYLLGALKFKNLDAVPEAPLPKQLAFWGAAAAGCLLNNLPLQPETPPKIISSSIKEVELPVDTERLRPYLPFSLQRGLSRRVKPETAVKYMAHLKALLENVQSYCPLPVLKEAQGTPHHIQGSRIKATLLFADISGFTKISEELNTRGRKGAEEITRLVNRYFTAMVDICVKTAAAC